MSNPCPWESLVRRILIEWQDSEAIISPKMTDLFTEGANMVQHEDLHAETARIDEQMGQAADLVIERMIAGNKPEDASALPKDFDFLVNRLEYVGGPWPTPRSMMLAARIYTDEWEQPSKKVKRKMAKLARKRWKKEKKHG